MLTPSMVDVGLLPSGMSLNSAGAVLVSIDPIVPSSHGATNWLVNPRRDVYAARTRLASVESLQNTSLVTHEMLHALGFHHTCAWPAVMGGYGCFAEVRLTAQDVAAVTLAAAVRRAQLAGAPSTGLAEARAGEQEAAAAPLAARAPAVGPATRPRAAHLTSDAAGPAVRQLTVPGQPVWEAGAP